MFHWCVGVTLGKSTGIENRSIDIPLYKFESWGNLYDSILGTNMFVCFDTKHLYIWEKHGYFCYMKRVTKGNSQHEIMQIISSCLATWPFKQSIITSAAPNSDRVMVLICRIDTTKNNISRDRQYCGDEFTKNKNKHRRCNRLSIRQYLAYKKLSSYNPFEYIVSRNSQHHMTKFHRKIPTEQIQFYV